MWSCPFVYLYFLTSTYEQATSVAVSGAVLFLDYTNLAAWFRHVFVFTGRRSSESLAKPRAVVETTSVLLFRFIVSAAAAPQPTTSRLRRRGMPGAAFRRQHTHTPVRGPISRSGLDLGAFPTQRARHFWNSRGVSLTSGCFCSLS